MTDTTAIIPAATVADRIDQVCRWILSGASEHEIRQGIAANFPNAKARPLIVDAMKRISKAGEGEPAIVRAWVREATRTTYQRALEASDFGSALRALRMILDMSEGE